MREREGDKRSWTENKLSYYKLKGERGIKAYMIFIIINYNFTDLIHCINTFCVILISLSSHCCPEEFHSRAYWMEFRREAWKRWPARRSGMRFLWWLLNKASDQRMHRGQICHKQPWWLTGSEGRWRRLICWFERKSLPRRTSTLSLYVQIK